MVICAASLKLLLRIGGSASGSGKPIVVWRWSPKKGDNIGEFKSFVKAHSNIAGALDYPGYLGSNRSGVLQGIGLDRDWLCLPTAGILEMAVGLGWSAFAVQVCSLTRKSNEAMTN